MRTPYKSKPPIQEAEDFSRWAPAVTKFDPKKLVLADPVQLAKERPLGLRRRVGELIYDLGAELESAEMTAGKVTGRAIRDAALQDIYGMLSKLKRL